MSTKRVGTTYPGRKFAAFTLDLSTVEPWRHQVAELPPIAVGVSEHRLHRALEDEIQGEAARLQASKLEADLAKTWIGDRQQLELSKL